ncbi:MAG: hypothetical protein H7101_13385 [Deinococcales bacterium]|nr:hypothetical protein [Chitinophagaceae bacterium]
MQLLKRTKLEWVLSAIVFVAFCIYIYFLLVTDSPPKWAVFLNIIGWLILLTLNFRNLKVRLKRK